MSGVVDLKEAKFVTKVDRIKVFDKFDFDKRWNDDVALLKVSSFSMIIKITQINPV